MPAMVRALETIIRWLAAKLGADIPFQSNHSPYLIHDVLLIKKISAPNAINSIQ